MTRRSTSPPLIGLPVRLSRRNNLYSGKMRELTSIQIAALERVLGQGFSPTMIPLYPNFICVRRNAYGVLLAPVEGGGFCFFGDACYLIDGNLSVLVRRAEREW